MIIKLYLTMDLFSSVYTYLCIFRPHYFFFLLSSHDPLQDIKGSIKVDIYGCWHLLASNNTWLVHFLFENAF